MSQEHRAQTVGGYAAQSFVPLSDIRRIQQNCFGT